MPPYCNYGEGVGFPPLCGGGLCEGGVMFDCSLDGHVGILVMAVMVQEGCMNVQTTHK